jgi:hypothetical protein
MPSAHHESYEECGFPFPVPNFVSYFQLFNWTPDSPDNRLFEPLFTASDFDGSDEDKFTVLSPGNYNLHLDRDILWQCPGYEYDSG